MASPWSVHYKYMPLTKTPNIKKEELREETDKRLTLLSYHVVDRTHVQSATITNLLGTKFTSDHQISLSANKKKAYHRVYSLTMQLQITWW